jgi:hypothetical protein
MKEKIFNLFVYVDSDFISHVGAVCHELDGTDDDKISFLQANYKTDFENVVTFRLPKNVMSRYKGELRDGIEYRIFRDLCHKGQSLLIFENVFKKYDACQTPLVVQTMVKDGVIIIEEVGKLAESKQSYSENILVDMQGDWISQYLDQSGLHLDRLINDDFFDAIRLLYNKKLYVSSMKLLLICIDTIAYLEYGDVNGNFQKWIKTYSNISEIDVTANELWEFRNSILHMTNLDSRKIREGKEKRLQFYTSNLETNYVTCNDEGKCFKFIDLLNCIATGIENWGQSFNLERQKFETFVSRYDRIISDKRKTYIYQ